MEILIFILFGALVVGIAVYGYYQNKKRIAALTALAAQRGWRFRADKDFDMEGRYAGFACLKQGSRRYAFNILEGASAGRGLCGFDYHYETYSTDSKGNTQTHHHYFSAIVLETGLPLQPLFIRSENFFDKIGELFGFDDIDFESAEFSRRFCVKAPDRRWAFDVLHQQTMEFLLASPRFTIEFAGTEVIAYRSNVFDPTEFDQALAVISGIIDRLPGYLLRELKEPIDKT